MRTRLISKWLSLRDTLWPIPAMMTTTAVVLALLLIQLDERVLVRDGLDRWWLFSGGSAGARGVLSTIAATSMTIATMAFSITIVALQLGSSQFSPRILRGFTGDRGNQVVLGIFVSTFAYSLVTLRSIGTETDDQHRFVPGVAVTVAIALAFVMIAALIYFFHHATRSIQATVIIDRAVQDTRGLIDRENDRRDEMTLLPALPAMPETAEPITSDAAGYIQTIDVGSLKQAAKDLGGILHVLDEEGDYVLPGTVLAVLWVSEPDSKTDEAEEGQEDTSDNGRGIAAVRSAFSLGMERTLAYDVDLGIRQVSDIALKALSPGINDPTTAIACIDRLGELLELTMSMRTGTYAVRDEDEQIRLLMDLDGFDVYLGIAFDQIRHYGAGDATLMLHLLQTLEMLARKASDAASRYELKSVAALAVAETQLQSLPEADRVRIETAAQWALSNRL